MSNEKNDWSKFKTKCCNPFAMDSKTKHSGELRNVTQWMSNHKNIEIGMKFCDACRLRLAEELRTSENKDVAGIVRMRVNNIYDIDNKTYLIRLQRNEEKHVLLLESGIRIHITNFEWPKNVAPSGFSMKLRKHLKNKRLESLSQLGTDRIVDLQFGTGEASYHIILELYDRGNIVLTDYQMIILNVLRPHTEGEKIRFAVREKYPQNRARDTEDITKATICNILKKGKLDDQLKKLLVSNLDYGPAITEHVLLKQGFSNATKIGNIFDTTNDIEKVVAAISEADLICQSSKKEHSKGYIIQKKEECSATQADKEPVFYSNQEFHPMLFQQHISSPFQQFETFNMAVDEFFSTLGSQRLELKAVQQQREALKKLENVRKDHIQRLTALENVQEVDKQKAELLTRNQELVEKAILSIQLLLANQISWEDIDEMVKDAASKGDYVAQRIKKIKLEINHCSLYLDDPYKELTDNDAPEIEERSESSSIPSMLVDVDLALSAFANARRYYDQKRTAAKKQQKTIDAQSKALKSAEKKTMQTLKDVQIIANINKARKVYWFEKFFWFISSENYLVIAGRDQQQNELIVKRYMKPTDVYVHADVHGASSVLIKNPSGQSVPPKTLNEAGTMAICYRFSIEGRDDRVCKSDIDLYQKIKSAQKKALRTDTLTFAAVDFGIKTQKSVHDSYIYSVAWEAKVVTNAYWVWGEQVTKTAPTGEYLTTGSFMVRGKKHFLPPSLLVLGFGFLFRLEDSFLERHFNERKVLTQSEQEVVEVRVIENSKDEFEGEILEKCDGGETEAMSKEDTDKGIEYGGSDKQESVETELSSDSEEELKFPDTHIKIQHFGGTQRNISSQPVAQGESKETHRGIIHSGDKNPVLVKTSLMNARTVSKSCNRTEGSSKDGVLEPQEQPQKQKQVKRGQKSRMKKMKEVYKNQDEEEKRLRMEILQSSNLKQDTKKSKKVEDAQAKAVKKMKLKVPKPNNPKDDVDSDEPPAQADVDMIDSLTGMPFADDELLFAVPVVAPYNTLSNYKFKVKLNPGTTRRGKAARTALATFLRDRTITQRERDLLRAVKDELLSRNLPGKVKLSASKMQNLRK